MILNNYKNVLLHTISEFGEEHQLDVAIEELSELIKEICKSKRGGDNLEYVCEEMADVYIMLEQLKIIFNLDESDIDGWIKFKTRRLQGIYPKDKKGDTKK